MTGQPLASLLDCPSNVVAALRMAWQMHIHEQNARQAQAHGGR